MYSFSQTETLFTTLTYICARYSFLLHFVFVKINLSSLRWKAKHFNAGWYFIDFCKFAHKEKFEEIISQNKWGIELYGWFSDLFATWISPNFWKEELEFAAVSQIFLLFQKISRFYLNKYEKCWRYFILNYTISCGTLKNYTQRHMIPHSICHGWYFFQSFFCVCFLKQRSSTFDVGQRFTNTQVNQWFQFFFLLFRFKVRATLTHRIASQKFKVSDFNEIQRFQMNLAWLALQLNKTLRICNYFNFCLNWVSKNWTVDRNGKIVFELCPNLVDFDFFFILLSKWFLLFQSSFIATRNVFEAFAQIRNQIFHSQLFLVYDAEFLRCQMFIMSVRCAVVVIVVVVAIRLSLLHAHSISQIVFKITTSNMRL